MGWRYALGWFAGRPRCWVAVAAFAVATSLAGRDGNAAWALVVAVSTGTMAALAVRVTYVDDHPDLAERVAARRQAEVDDVLFRHAHPTRAERQAAREQAEIDAILWRYERQRAARRRAARE